MPFDFLDFVAHGLMPLPWWGYFVVALAFTHVTIACVTIFLHRAQAHRALELHPAVSHFFRFWLWLTTGMVTKEWVAIHRKHHARVETAGGPAQPANARHQHGLLARHGALSRRSEERRNDREIRPRHARRLDGAQRLHALLVGRRRPDADGELHAVRRRRDHDLGRADGVDSGHRGRRHQRHRPLLGLSQFRLRRRLEEHRALGHPDRRRGAAQQSSRVRNVGEAFVALVRIRPRLDVHPHPRSAGPRRSPQRRADAQGRAGRQDDPRRRDAACRHREPLCGRDGLRAHAQGHLRDTSSRDCASAPAAATSPTCRASAG